MPRRIRQVSGAGLTFEENPVEWSSGFSPEVFKASPAAARNAVGRLDGMEQFDESEGALDPGDSRECFFLCSEVGVHTCGEDNDGDVFNACRFQPFSHTFTAAPGKFPAEDKYVGSRAMAESVDAAESIFGCGDFVSAAEQEASKQLSAFLMFLSDQHPCSHPESLLHRSL
jgi:hypothetical protein